MPPRRNVRSASRKSTPSSPPKAKESTQSPRQTRQAAREQSRELSEAPNPVRQKQPLSRVEEEREITRASLQPSNDESVSQQEMDEDDEAKFESDESYSSTGSEEFDALDRDVMIDNLASMSADADTFLSLLQPAFLQKTLRDYTDVSSATSKRVSNLASRLATNLKSFGDPLFLSVGLIVRRLGQRPRDEDENLLSYGKWRPDSILMKINLALFVLRLLSRAEPKKMADERRQCLQYLAEIDMFPSPFMPTRLPASQNELSSELYEPVVHVWVSILTQWFIQSATAASEDQSSFDPDQILSDAFWDAEGNLRQIFNPDRQSMEQGSVLLEERINEIRSSFSTNTKRPINLKQLTKQFPWTDLIENVAEWLHLQASELEKQITAVGGVPAIQEALWSEDYSPFAKSTTETSRRKSNRSSLGKRIERMRQRDAEHRAKRPLNEIKNRGGTDAAPSARKDSNADQEIPQSPDAGYATAEEVIPQEDAAQIIANDDESEQDRQVTREEDDPVPTQATNYVLELVASQAKESNKENIPTPRKGRLLDHQAGAVRETWDSPEPVVLPAKRRAPSIPESSDEDDEFENDNRTPKRARTSTAAGKAKASAAMTTTEDEQQRIPAIPVRPHKRRLPSGFEQNDDGEDTIELRPPTPPSRSRRRPPIAAASSHLDADEQEPPPSSYEEVNRLAKATVSSARMQNPAARSTPIYTTYPRTGPIPYPQARRAWTADEITALIEAVGEYGCKWSMILDKDSERAIPRLQERNQVQLKDKARNIKLDFLKARQPLPVNFHDVTISKGHMEMLTSMGIPFIEERFEDNYQPAD